MWRGLTSEKKEEELMGKKKAETFMRKWGKRIVNFDFDRSVNPRVRIPIKGI
jgi:hypothetical protein